MSAPFQSEPARRRQQSQESHGSSPLSQVEYTIADFDLDKLELNAPVWLAPPEYDGNYVECRSKTPKEVEAALLKQFTERVEKQQDLDFSQTMPYKFHCRVFGSGGDASESTVSIWTPSEEKCQEGVQSVLYMSRSTFGNAFLLLQFRDEVLEQFRSKEGGEMDDFPSFGFGFAQMGLQLEEKAEEEQEMELPLPLPMGMAMGMLLDEDQKEHDVQQRYDPKKYVYGILNHLIQEVENAQKEQQEEKGSSFARFETDVQFFSDEDVPYYFAQMTKRKEEVQVVLKIKSQRCDVVELVLQSVKVSYQFDAQAIRNLLQGLRDILKAHNGYSKSRLQVNFAKHTCALEHVKKVWEQGPVRKLGQYQFRIEPSQQAALQAQSCIAEVAAL